MTKSVAYIDGDLIAFRAASAAQKRSIRAYRGDAVRTFVTRTELKKWLAEDASRGLYSDYSIEDIQTPEPVENCLHTVKMMIADIHRKSGCDEFVIVVQGGKDSKPNFRDSIPLPRKYKGGRDGGMRPVHLSDCHNYLRNRYNALVAEGRESDDVIASAAWAGYVTGQKIVQCTIDKDANGCTGWLLNWDKMESPVLVKGLGSLYMKDGKVKGTGRKWFYAQVLLGDSTDDYKPTDLCDAQFGDVSVFKALDPCTTDAECWNVIADCYKRWYPSPVTYPAWDGIEHTKSWWEILQMYVDCAHMQRWDGDRVNVVEVLDKFGVEIDDLSKS